MDLNFVNTYIETLIKESSELWKQNVMLKSQLLHLQLTHEELVKKVKEQQNNSFDAPEEVKVVKKK